MGVGRAIEIPARNASIEGVAIVPLATLSDDRGAVFHMLKATAPHFAGFGEIYFSSIYPGVVKGWKRHRRMTANYSCILGRIELVLYDDRERSSTKGCLMKLCLGPNEHSLVVIPPEVWHGFEGLAHPASIVANCASEPSDSAELDRMDPDDGRIPHRWRRRVA